MSGSIANAFKRAENDASYLDCADLISRASPVDPVYLFCRQRLQQRAHLFLDHFPGQVSYAVKANPETRVLRTLCQLGLQHFDVASLDEIARVANCCPDAELHFNNPVKAEQSIAEAYAHYGVRSFALDEASELEKIRRCTAGDPSVTYTVRFKLDHAGAAYDFGSKFGACPDRAVQLLRSIDALGARAALTFHPGSQCTDPVMYTRYIEAAAGILQRSGVAVRFLNVGGGFPEHYPGTELPAMEHYFRTIDAASQQFLGGTIALMCEPGRGMTARAASLLTRVIHVRDCGVSVFINDGVYGGMQEQSLIDLQLPVKAWREGTPLQGQAQAYRIFGPTCDPVDKLARETLLPRGLRAGDYIEFGMLGAYGSATSTSFNGFSPGSYVDVLRATEFSLQGTSD